jgi:hypothetical protein
MKLSRIAYLIAICCVAVGLHPDVTTSAGKPDINQQIESTVSRVRKAKTEDMKSNAAQHLIDLTDNRDNSDVTNETINSVISLLDMPDDAVRVWVAAALGNFGPRAKAAVPKLLTILADIECKNLDFSSASTIPVALGRMGVTPPPRNCQQH